MIKKHQLTLKEREAFFELEKIQVELLSEENILYPKNQIDQFLPDIDFNPFDEEPQISEFFDLKDNSKKEEVSQCNSIVSTEKHSSNVLSIVLRKIISLGKNHGR